MKIKYFANINRVWLQKQLWDFPANEGGGENPDGAAREGGVATIRSLPSIERKDSLWDKTFEGKMFIFQLMLKLKRDKFFISYKTWQFFQTKLSNKGLLRRFNPFLADIACGRMVNCTNLYSTKPHKRTGVRIPSPPIGGRGWAGLKLR